MAEKTKYAVYWFNPRTNYPSPKVVQEEGPTPGYFLIDADGYRLLGRGGEPLVVQGYEQEADGTERYLFAERSVAEDFRSCIEEDYALRRPLLTTAIRLNAEEQTKE